MGLGEKRELEQDVNILKTHKVLNSTEKFF